MPKRLWTRDEMILTLALYFQLPFGRLNHTTPEVRELAKLMSRTENAVVLRLVNFAACDKYTITTLYDSAFLSLFQREYKARLLLEDCLFIA